MGPASQPQRGPLQGMSMPSRPQRGKCHQLKITTEQHLPLLYKQARSRVHLCRLECELTP